METKDEMVELMDKIPGSFRSILNSEVSTKYNCDFIETNVWHSYEVFNEKSKKSQLKNLNAIFVILG